MDLDEAMALGEAAASIEAMDWCSWRGVGGDEKRLFEKMMCGTWWQWMGKWGKGGRGEVGSMRCSVSSLKVEMVRAGMCATTGRDVG